ncbi:MAG: DUF3372 domain-containing protein, partial [Acidimicrobiia bacterium]|nr:DUF3372 domain-containing protein [Acidimicrobiia bacterium]
TGLYNDPNETDQGGVDDQLADLLLKGDQIRAGMAANLADYAFESFTGEPITGSEVDYNGAPTGYTTDPQEVINYVSAHDNETFFDIVQTKSPLGMSMEDRTRIQNLALDIVAFGQGIPFFHAGSELLRSKSLDKDSYNSGDWFNAIDFTYKHNGWANGLPVEDKNADRWDLATDLFGRDDLVPSSTDIRGTLNRFLESLEIRASSPLFRLQTAADVLERVEFHNTGTEQVPGLIVMTVDDTIRTDLDPDRDVLVVIINATAAEQVFTIDGVTGARLHPIQADSTDAITRTASVSGSSFTVPARTASVFEVPQG